jgi:hypothetical protein
MRWLVLWTFVAGGVGAVALHEARVAPSEVAALPAGSPAVAAEAEVVPTVAPPPRGFGGVPSTVPAVAVAAPSDGPAPPDQEDVDSEGCIPDVEDRCPDFPTGDDADGCPQPTIVDETGVTEVLTVDGRTITRMPSSIIIY